MSRAIVIRTPGGLEALKMEDVPVRKLQPNEVLVRQTVIGLNYMDVYQRTGYYPTKGELPIPGFEGVGVIEAVGSNTTGFKEGARVACVTVPYGAYAQHRIVDQSHIIAIPDDISDEMAAAVLVKGLTAHFLLFRTFAVQPVHTILVHAAAGGVGHVLCQWAKHLGAKVIATVGTGTKVEAAKATGADLVINLENEDMVDQVLKFTNDEGVTVVYDGVGKATFMNSLRCLMPLGLMVSYGQASGPVPKFDVTALAENCLFLTRPSLFLYKSNKMELILSENEVFEMIRRRVIKIKLNKRYKFTEESIREAHRDLEGRKTSGASIIVVE